jgi:DNA-binding winged helix-turn-helix (wHTH) protein/TolB-like protein
VPLKPKVFDTLLVLVENSGRVVDKEELMQLIWPDVAVEENNLTQNISAIRKSLGDRQNEHRYVLTVPGRGYRFVADVRKTPNADEAQATPAMSIPEGRLELQDSARQSGPAKRYWWLGGVILALLLGAVGFFVVIPRMRSAVVTAPAYSDPGTSKRITSIAVLPFKPLGAEAANEYAGPGMADALITKLSNSRQLTVRSTSVVLRYDNSNQDSLAAGRELGVDSVLEGKIQRSGDHVRVTVQLVRVSDGASL